MASNPIYPRDWHSTWRHPAALREGATLPSEPWVDISYLDGRYTIAAVYPHHQDGLVRMDQALLLAYIRHLQEEAGWQEQLRRLDPFNGEPG